MKVRRTTEDYLKVIYLLSQTGDEVHACQISQELQLSRPTVSVAVRRLAEEGYLEIHTDNAICLTDAGRQLARNTCEKYRILRDFLLRLGVDPANARQDACRMEHDISGESYDALKKFMA